MAVSEKTSEGSPLLGDPLSPGPNVRKLCGMPRLNGVESEYRVYKRRWFMLLVVCILNLSNAMIWITFSPIADLTTIFYDITTMDVNWLSLVYLISSIPFGFCASWLIDTFGLRLSLILASWLNCSGSVMRVISAVPTLPHDAKFPLLIIGQTISACSQPFVMFSPTKLAALWFSENQRASANMLASMSNPLGIMIASLLSPVIVKNEDDIPLLLQLYTIPAALVTLLATFGVHSSEPPSPPTSSAAEKSEPFLVGLKKIVRIKSYIVLCICFGAGLGIFTTLSTLVEQILCPRGYSNSFSGLCGALMIAGGIIGAGIIGPVVDRTKKFEEAIIFAAVLATLSGICFTEVSRLRHFEVPTAICITLLGMFGFALYPVSMEVAVECTFPVAEATSSGLLIISGQLQGIIFIMLMQFIAQPLSPEDLSLPMGCSTNSTSGGQVIPQDYTVPNLFASGVMTLLSCSLIIFFKPTYRRILAEKINIAQKIVDAK